MLYEYWQTTLAQQFTPVETLRDCPRSQVRVLRHSVTGQWMVLRTYEGSPAPYRALLGLVSPHLPQIYEAVEENGRALVLEEYIAGDNLSQLLERGPAFSAPQVRDIGRQLCRALWVLHSRGIVHRDVKPENVILRGREAVLIDLDAARLRRDAQQQDTQILGTVGYAAPEQFGLGQTDGRADLYALGVLLNVLRTGAHPSVCLAPGRLGRVVARCTMVNPNQRYASAEQLLAAL